MIQTRGIPGRLLALLAFVLPVLSTSPALASDCPTLLPDDAVAISSPALCRAGPAGGEELFSCQDYRAGKERFRVLFKGGQIPRRVLHIDARGQQRLVWQRTATTEAHTCSLLPPEMIPAEAVHRGTGVCYDDDERAVPCSMFEHAVPREEEFHRYMVYYFPGSPVVEKFDAGRNENALVAEFAYQLGLSLLNTRCCSEEAIGYLEYAYRLFPRADLYGRTYEEARFLLTARAHPTDFALYLD